MRFYWFYWPLVPFAWLNVVASLALAMVYRVKSVHWSAGCLEFVAGRRNDGTTRIWGRPAAQCLGCPVVQYDSDEARKNKGLRVHERIHDIHGVLIQAAVMLAVWVPLLSTGAEMHWLWWGTIGLVTSAAFGIAYGAHFLWNWYRKGWGDWKPAYYRTWSERIAYRIQREFKKGLRPNAHGAKL